MSKINDLIKQLCPNGVEYKKLGETGLFYSGLRSKTSKDFNNGNAKYVTYMNIFSNQSIDFNKLEFVQIYENEKQNNLEIGDILFTGSSETVNECGMSSVITNNPSEKIYLNSFCFGFRLHDKTLFLPNFTKYLFRSNELREQIVKTANGVTRFNVSKKKMEEIIVPIVPLLIQEEIVRILDNFTKLTAELTAELTARKIQYEYYRNTLLDFDNNKFFNTKLNKMIKELCPNGVEYRKIGSFTDIQRGRRLIKSQLVFNGRYPVFHGGLEPLGYYSFFNRVADTVMIINVGASAGSVGYSNIDFWSSDGCFCIEKCELLINRYLYYILSDIEMDIKSKIRFAGIPTLDGKCIENLLIPLPPLPIQEEIVRILDKFDNIVNDITQGLPALIEKYKTMYEYYRNKLLTFKELV